MFIQEGVETIEDFVFDDCSNLTNVYIPKSVRTIGSYVFYDCVSLDSIYYTGAEYQWRLIHTITIIPSTVTIHYDYVE